MATKNRILRVLRHIVLQRLHNWKAKKRISWELWECFPPSRHSWGPLHTSANINTCCSMIQYDVLKKKNMLFLTICWWSFLMGRFARREDVAQPITPKLSILVLTENPASSSPFWSCLYIQLPAPIPLPLKADKWKIAISKNNWSWWIVTNLCTCSGGHPEKGLVMLHCIYIYIYCIVKKKQPMTIP